MNYWIAASFALLVVVAVSAYFDNYEDMLWTRIGVPALYLWSGTVSVLIGLGVTRLMGW